MDGTDDIINIGADPLVLLSGNNGIEDKSHLFKDTLKEIKSGNQNDVGNVWTHTTAIGDFDNNGTIDIIFHLIFLIDLLKNVCPTP